MDRGSPVLEEKISYAIERRQCGKWSVHVSESINTILAVLPDTRRDLDTRVLELGLVVCDGVFGAGVRPNDSLAERLASLATPSDGSLALVCDA